MNEAAYRNGARLRVDLAADVVETPAVGATIAGDLQRHADLEGSHIRFKSVGIDINLRELLHLADFGAGLDALTAGDRQLGDHSRDGCAHKEVGSLGGSRGLAST